MSSGRRWASVVAMGLVFGLVAGGTMFGVNSIGNYITGQNQTAQIAQTQTTGSSSSESSSSAAQGSGTVADVAANAMPSLVTISTMSVEADDS